MTLISTRYNDSQLELVESSPQQKKVWEEHPVWLTEAEKGALPLGLVVSVLIGGGRSPATLAGIKAEQIASPILRLINREYKQAYNNYKLKLLKATIADDKTIEANRKFLIKEDFWIFWVVFACFGCQFITREQFNRDAQAQRHAWLVEVGHNERERLNRIKMRIENAFPQIIEQLTAIAVAHQAYNSLTMQAWQLKRVYKTLFPDAPLAQDEDLKRLLPSEDVMCKELVTFKPET